MDLLLDTFGSDHVLGGFCGISSFIAGPGYITHVASKPFIVFGELNRQKNERIRKLRNVFSSLDGINIVAPEDIHVFK